MESDFALKVRRSAEDLFASGLYCAESVVVALAKAQGVESELLPKVATAFCSGMGRMGGPCGALTGAIMGVSLSLGRSEASQSVGRHTLRLSALFGSSSKSSALATVPFYWAAT